MVRVPIAIPIDFASQGKKPFLVFLSYILLSIGLYVLSEILLTGGGLAGDPPFPTSLPLNEELTPFWVNHYLSDSQGVVPTILMSIIRGYVFFSPILLELSYLGPSLPSARILNLPPLPVFGSPLQAHGASDPGRSGSHSMHLIFSFNRRAMFGILFFSFSL